MRTRSAIIATAFFGLLLSYNLSHGEEQTLERYIEEHNKFAISNYFSNLRAFTLFETRNEKTGDTIFIPNLAKPQLFLNPPRERCFPKFAGGTLRPQNVFRKPTLRRTLDLSGLIESSVPALAKAEIQGKMQMEQEIVENIKVLKMETAQIDDLLKTFDPNGCPELNSIIRNRTGTGNYIPIYEVYFAEGTISVTYKLKITGAFNSDTKAAIANFLRKLNISGLSLDAKADGSYDTVTQSSFDMNIDSPVAFRPLFIDQDHMTWVYDNYIKTGILSKIAASINDDLAIKKLVSGDRQIEALSQYASLYSPFAKGRNLIPYDSANQAHRDYVELNAYLVSIAHIVHPRPSAN